MFSIDSQMLTSAVQFYSPPVMEASSVLTRWGVFYVSAKLDTPTTHLLHCVKVRGVGIMYVCRDIFCTSIITSMIVLSCPLSDPGHEPQPGTLHQLLP